MLRLPTATAAGNVEVALVTGFSIEVFGSNDLASLGKKYPQLLTVGFLLHSGDPLPFLAAGPLVFARVPEPIIAGSYQVWTSILPKLLKEPAAAGVAGQINALFSRMGLSCK